MPGPPVALLDTRFDRVRGRMSAAHLDALVVSSLPNLFYLTGFRGSAGLLVVSAEGETLLVDARYSTGVQVLRDEGRLPSSLEVVLVDRTYEEALVDVVRQRGGGRIGLEGAHTSLNRYRWLVAALGVAGTADVELVPTDRLVESLRAVKDECEVALLRRAAGLLAGRAPAILELVREGRSEREIAANLDRQLVEAGFERPAFETIVASGPNSALPHARPTARRLEAGDLVVLDFGGVYDGYCVDFARTVTVGVASAEAVRMVEAVARAQRLAIDGVRPGVRAGDIDAAARQSLQADGFGEAFSHSTGHGLGIEVHEEPRIRKRRTDAAEGPGIPEPGGEDDVLVPGMVFTVEPGAYVPGLGGVRIEDDVLVTATGSEVLTNPMNDSIAAAS